MLLKLANPPLLITANHCVIPPTLLIGAKKDSLSARKSFFATIHNRFLISGQCL